MFFCRTDSADYFFEFFEFFGLKFCRTDSAFGFFGNFGKFEIIFELILKFLKIRPKNALQSPKFPKKHENSSNRAARGVEKGRGDMVSPGPRVVAGGVGAV